MAGHLNAKLTQQAAVTAAAIAVPPVATHPDVDDDLVPEVHDDEPVSSLYTTHTPRSGSPTTCPFYFFQRLPILLLLIRQLKVFLRDVQKKLQNCIEVYRTDPGRSKENSIRKARVGWMVGNYGAKTP